MYLWFHGWPSLLTSLCIYDTDEKKSLTSEPHDAVVAALEEQPIHHKRGWHRLGGRGVDFRAVILKETKEIKHKQVGSEL